VRADDIRRVLVIGSGTMGLQIGLQAAAHGFDVVLHDADPAALDRAGARLRGYGEAAVAAGSMDADALETVLTRIGYISDPAAAAADADIVSESVPEDPGQGTGPQHVQRAVPGAGSFHDQYLDAASVDVRGGDRAA
jgi:3-hydroxybutyryl-CoA dehydrogenase